MLGKIKAYIEKWHMLQSEDCVIVGVSGGADSICLVLVLLELQKTMGFQMVAVHINHGLRGTDADADETFVKQFCMEHGILFESYFADVELFAKKRKQSTEEAGREVRREFFRQALEKHGGTKVALAHHQDDNAETLLLNLTRGTGLKGLGGIAPKKDCFIRPLLCVRRREIEDYLKERNVLYCTDMTNESDEYTRNRIRNHVLPYLEEHINSKTVEHMNETMEQLRQVQAYLDEQAQAAFECCVEKVDSKYLVKQERYADIPEVLRQLVLKKVLVKLAGREKDLEAVHIKQLQELFKKQTGRTVHLPYQMVAKRVYDGICIGQQEMKSLQNKEDNVFEMTDFEKNFQAMGKEIQCKVYEKGVFSPKTFEKSDTACFDCDIIENNICFRTRQEGDYITIHPDGRTQKLKAYFINEKIPQDLRDEILLVADGHHILWIVGYRKNCLYQIQEKTKKVLEININEGESHGGDNKCIDF